MNVVHLATLWIFKFEVESLDLPEPVPNLSKRDSR
jgi:hypothetical protein